MTTTTPLPLLGLSEIDRQHQGLYDCLDRLELWCRKGHGFPATIDAVTMLETYVAEHFAFEENFLREHGYPALDEHMAEHRQITAELQRLSQQVMDGGDVTEELVGMMRGWITQHIGVEDKHYATFFGAKAD
jgi:hemerythrin-like metal-binding protein